ncbi:MAG: SRPBCC family protein [Alphaproteobacteria bacterium]|nr:SRPBCC family protein [Alphaproteobacteria bacterium]
MRIPLLANATFSGLCGIIAITASGEDVALVADMPQWVGIALGFGLIGFGIAVAVCAIRLRLGWTLVISAADILWVVSTPLLLLIPALFTDLGHSVVWTVAGVVALFAFFQLRGLRLMLHDAAGPGRYRLCIRIHSQAPADGLWQVIADIGGIHRYSPVLTDSRIEDDRDPGVGAVRVCTNLQGQRWAEKIEAFDPANRSLTLRFLTEREDFPIPVETLTGGWQVTPDGEGSIVDIWWSLTPHQSPGWLIVTLMSIPLERDVRELIANMAVAAPDRRAAPRGWSLGLRFGYC